MWWKVREKDGPYYMRSTECVQFEGRLSHDLDQWLVAGGAVEGETELEVAFEGDGVGEFDGDLGEGEVGEGADGFDDEGIEVVVGVFELDRDGFAGEEIKAGGEEYDAGALV